MYLAKTDSFLQISLFGLHIKGSRIKASRTKGPEKRVPQQHWPIFKASRRRPFECTQIQTVHASRYLYGGMGPHEMYTISAAQPEIVSSGQIVSKKSILDLNFFPD